jgi:hypothetical protein
VITAEWAVAVFVVTVLLTAWVILTLTRLDRLHARVDAAHAALDAQLVRRAAALFYLAEHAPPVGAAAAAELARTAQSALSAGEQERQDAENRVGKALTELAPWREQLPADAVVELAEAATRVVIARRFYNDAVRDTRTLRSRRMSRIFHLAGHRELPVYFDIDDTVLFDRTAPGDPPPGAVLPNSTLPGVDTLPGASVPPGASVLPGVNAPGDPAPA